MKKKGGPFPKRNSFEKRPAKAKFCTKNWAENSQRNSMRARRIDPD